MAHPGQETPTCARIGFLGSLARFHQIGLGLLERREIAQHRAIGRRLIIGQPAKRHEHRDQAALRGDAFQLAPLVEQDRRPWPAMSSR
jgi:hypothetical protein